jgi:hypothetical protein
MAGPNDDLWGPVFLPLSQLIPLGRDGCSRSRRFSGRLAGQIGEVQIRIR